MTKEQAPHMIGAIENIRKHSDKHHKKWVEDMKDAATLSLNALGKRLGRVTEGIKIV